MKITLRGTPPSLNKYMGRENAWDYRAEKTRWTRAVLYAAMAAKDRPEQPIEKAEVCINYFFRTAVRHDADNYCGKFLLDGLTKAKVIVDDDFAHISLTVHGHVDRKNPRTEITVTRMWEG